MPRSRDVPTLHRSAPLREEFGLSYAIRLFGQATIDTLPRITRGPNKGKLKGYVHWLRTQKAGYHTNAGRAVAADTTVRAWLGEGMGTTENNATRALWLGRVQNVCGSMDLLNEEGRERWMQTERAAEAAHQAEIAEWRAEQQAKAG